MKREVKTFKMRSWRGICLLQYLPSLRYSSKGTSNNGKWTMPGTPKSYENTSMITKENLCIVVLSIIPLHKTSDLLFLNESSFYSRTWRFFKGRARVSHVSVNIKNNAEKDMTFFFSKSPGPSKLNLELHLGCHTCWLSCFLLVCLWFPQLGRRTIT